jgi:hypothetical protein
LKHDIVDSIARRFSGPVIRWLTPARLRLYPPHIPILILVLWSVSQYLGPGLLDLGGKVIGTDFMAFYTAGSFYLSDRMNDLYDFHEQALFQRQVVAPVAYGYVHAFVNPPYAALPFALFSWGSYGWSLALWYAVGLTTVFVSLHLLRAEITSLAGQGRSKMFFMAFLFFPAMAWLMYGQNTHLSFIIYVVFYVLLRRKQDLPAGLLLGLLACKPQLAIGPAVVLLAGRRWRALGGAASSSGLIVALGFLLFPQAMEHYLRILPYLSEIYRLRPNPDILVQVLGLGPELAHPSWGIHSFFGFSILLLDTTWRTGANILFFLLMSYGIASLARIWLSSGWEPGTRRWDLNMAASFGLSLLLSPQLFTYDLMALLLPLAILWGCYPRGTCARPLDGDRLLFWSALLYLFCFVGSYLTCAQLKLLGLAGLPGLAVQFSTPVILAWVRAILLASKAAGGCSPHRCRAELT